MVPRVVGALLHFVKMVLAYQLHMGKQGQTSHIRVMYVKGHTVKKVNLWIQGQYIFSYTI